MTIIIFLVTLIAGGGGAIDLYVHGYHVWCAVVAIVTALVACIEAAVFWNVNFLEGLGDFIDDLF